MKNERKFSGIWVPQWLYLNREFTWLEKILMLEVNSLDKGEGGCYASNGYLAEFLGSTAGHIANTISKLRKAGYIVDLTGPDGKRRIRLSEELRASLGDKPTEKTVSFMGMQLPVEDSFPAVADEIMVPVASDEAKQAFMQEWSGVGKAPKNKMEIETILEFWNQYRGRAPWKSHEKVSYDIAEAINDALKHYTTEEICAAIDNYAKILLDGKYFWTHAWSLSVFLTVKNGPAKDAPRKWYQFLPDNFVEANYLTNKPEKEQAIDDGEYDEELVTKLVGAYTRAISNPTFVPDQRQKHKFVEASKMMKEFFDRYDIQKDNWVKHLILCLDSVYINKGEKLYPGHFSSNNTWSILMPQYIAEVTGVSVE